VIVPEKPIDRLSYKKNIKDAVQTLCIAHSDVFITVGGDGLAAYVADALITWTEESGLSTPPIAGIAAGTANVGPIVSIPIDKVSMLIPGTGSIVPTGAVAVYDGDRRLGFGFNDIVIGNTFLGTIDGITCNLSVTAMVGQGNQVIVIPGEHIASKDFSIAINDKVVVKPSDIPSEKVKQIVVSSLQFDRLYGRAIMGDLIKGTYQNDTAALIISDKILVTFNSHEDEKRLATIHQLVFKSPENITLTGLGPDAHVIIDGNPYVREYDSITFSYKPNSIPVWQINQGSVRHVPSQEEHRCKN
ncbi:MAG: diacylglycerol kinase family protein, partial [Sphaerochaetaceae bacterium]|nr:diacylglycerol kinase family protein [Sphaerochaetaceae bacterium]